MRIGGRLAAGVSSLLLMAMMAPPAAATPHPRPGEWWFSAWGIEKDVWPLTRGAGVTVAVLDSGVNAALPELSGAVLKGGDTTGRTSDGRKDFDNSDGGHGTGLSVLIAGQGGGTTGLVGIAPEAKILPVNVKSRIGDSVGLYEAIAAGIRYSANHRAKVINISLGINSGAMPGHCDPGIQQAVAYAVDHDVVVVASSGNEGNRANWPDLPASCAGVLAVGAIEKDLTPWPDGQRQPYVAVAAPGVGGVVGKRGQYYPHASGTSISAALASGAIALIRSRNPHMSARVVVQRLIATAHHGKASLWNNQIGYGAIQITSAMNPVKYPIPDSAPNPVYTALEKWRASHASAARVGPERSSTASTQTDGRDKSESSTSALILGAIAILVIFALTVFAIIVRRRRSRIQSAAVANGERNYPHDISR